MAKKPSFPLRGFVYLVQLDPTFGHEIRKNRPALVVSNNHMNELAATVIVMPITTGRFGYYHWVPVVPPEGGVAKPSSIVTEQMRAVDKRRLGRRLGRLRPATMVTVEQAILDHCALPGGMILP